MYAAEHNKIMFTIAMVAVAASALALDMMSKWIAVEALPHNSSLQLIPGFLELWLRDNPHGAFGLFSSFPSALRLPLLVGLAILAVTAMLFYTIKTLGRTITASVAMGLVLGGASANLMDRILRGVVVDFIHLHWGKAFDWPTFNLADVTITIGSIILAITVIKQWKHSSTTDESFQEEIS